MKTEDLTTGQAANRLKDFQNLVGEKAKNVSSVTDEYVHDHPWQTVALAAIVGCILGFLLRPRD
jgi:ElaB/YqjD/DUF883 family membrane-anchored ribosome-binding protein